MQLAKGTRTPTSLRTAKLVVYPRSSFFPPLLLDISPVHSTATFNSSSYEFFVSYFFFFFFKHESNIWRTGETGFQVSFFLAFSFEGSPLTLGQHLAARIVQRLRSGGRVEILLIRGETRNRWRDAYQEERLIVEGSRGVMWIAWSNVGRHFGVMERHWLEESLNKLWTIFVIKDIKRYKLWTIIIFSLDEERKSLNFSSRSISEISRELDWNSHFLPPLLRIFEE